MYQRLTSEGFEAVDGNTKASRDELQQAGSSFVVKLRHCPPEPLHDGRLGVASFESSVSPPVFGVNRAYAAHHDLTRTACRPVYRLIPSLMS